MAKEGWTGGPCIFDPAANLQGVDCPQNLLTSFTSVSDAPQAALKAAVNRAATGLASKSPLPAAAAEIASFNSSGRTTHPNSTFITIAGVPEDLTTVQLANAHPGNWFNSEPAVVSFSSQPPNLAGALLPGAASFVASPIASITYGISTPGAVPQPGFAIPMDTTVTNPTPCPVTTGADTPSTVFAPSAQEFTGLADGQYLVHYYAQDCAGTQELQFSQPGSGVWSTSYYTYPVNIDTVAPAVAVGPVLSPTPGTYSIGQAVTASYRCTDATSGVVQCGAYKYAVGATKNTGALTTVVDTVSPGTKSFVVRAIDAAGNQSSASVSYKVGGSYDTQIEVLPSVSKVTFPEGTGVTV